MKSTIRHSIRAFLRLFLPAFHKTFYPRSPARVLPEAFAPQRVLVFNGAHIGDIVISTSILPILRSAYPQAKIGFVAGSWSSMVLKNHPDIDYLHCIDHWRLDRSSKSILSKIRNYRRTRRIALREIRNTRYDLALHIYTWSYPDFLDVSWYAGIPVRLSLGKSLLAPLATATTDVPTDYFMHQSELQAQVLRPLNLATCHLGKRRARLPQSTSDAIQEVCSFLELDRIDDRPYCIIHTGSGAPIRELSQSVWREVAQRLSKSYKVVFTGKGDRERTNAASVMSGLTGCINACDRLSWDAFVAAIRYAEIVYGVESMAGHIAAAVGTRCVVAYTGMAGVARWRPESPNCMVLTQHISCAPCEQPRGCKEMTCLRSIKALDLVGHPEPETTCQVQVAQTHTATKSVVANEDSLSPWI